MKKSLYLNNILTHNPFFGTTFMLEGKGSWQEKGFSAMELFPCFITKVEVKLSSYVKKWPSLRRF